MKYILSLYFILFSLTIAHADLSVEMDAKVPNSTNLLMSVVDRIKDNKVREDTFFEGGYFGGEILNLDTGEKFKLVPDKKMVVKIPFNQSDLTNAIAVDAIKDTGKADTVNGYNAEIYISKNSTSSYTLWVAKDFPHFEVIKKDLIKRDRLNAVTQSGILHLSTLPGMLLKFGNATTNAGEYNPQFQVLIKEEPIDGDYAVDGRLMW